MDYAKALSSREASVCSNRTGINFESNILESGVVVHPRFNLRGQKVRHNMQSDATPISNSTGKQYADINCVL